MGEQAAAFTTQSFDANISLVSPAEKAVSKFSKCSLIFPVSEFPSNLNASGHSSR